MLNDDIIKERQEQMKNEPTIYAWSTTTFAIGGGEAYRWKKKCASLGPVILTMGLYMFADSNILLFIAAVLFGVLGYLYGYYLAFSDSYLQYRLTRLGLEASREEVLPKSTFTVIRGIAWFGVAVCVFTVVLIGPLAFVGAGAFALMSFKFTGLTQKKDVTQYVFDEKMIIANILDNNCILLMPNPLTWISTAKIYFSMEERKIILTKLEEMLNEVYYIEVKDENSARQNPIYRGSIKKGQEIYSASHKKENDEY